MLTADKFKRVGYTKEEAERIDRPTISYWQDAWRRFCFKECKREESGNERKVLVWN